MKKRFTSISLIAVLTLTLTGCGGVFATLRGAVAASTPLINSLADRGIIDRVKADLLKTDFTDLVNATEALNVAFKAATTRAQKLVAVQTAANAWVAIVARGHFVAVPQQLKDAMGIIDAVFATLVAFYGGAPGGAETVQQSEEDLLKHVEQEAKRLKAKLKVK